MRAVFISFFTGLCDPNLSSKPSILTTYKHDSKQVFLLYIFSMVKTFDCSKCGGRHARPINRNCKNTEKEQPMDTNTRILNELKNLSGRMLQMESRIDNISSRTSSPVRSLSRSEKGDESPARTTEARTQVLHESASSLEDDLVLPTLATIRRSRSIQEQVDTRIKELQAVNKDKGKFKSQRGGSETIWVKNEIAWPHNFVLSGNMKNRVTYDNLSLSQWVSGFATIIKDENDVETKNKMLEYLSELMEDSHDFGWSSAKGSHAVLLCRMEEGRVTWKDTHKIDRVRRAYAHRSTSHSQGPSGSKKVSPKDVPTPCKYYQRNSCSHKNDHETGGRTYLHICSICHGQGKNLSHSSKDCRKSKND